MREKIGLTSVEDGDLDLIQSLLAPCTAAGRFHADLPPALASAGRRQRRTGFSGDLRGTGSGEGMASRWRERLWREMTVRQNGSAAMLAVNPAFIPRNHRIEQAIARRSRMPISRCSRHCDVLAKPYEDQPTFAAYWRLAEAGFGS
jgi:uncharacterized protein YdiU (UPF0061 family)